MDRDEAIRLLKTDVKAWNEWREKGEQIPDLSDANLRDADLRDADLSGALLSGAVLRRTDLFGAVLNGANLSRAYLSDADLRRAYLAGAFLSDADLRRAYLAGSDLSGANFSGAKLLGADLSGATLSGAKLSGAKLSGADLNGADLRCADLAGADLSGAKFFCADLSGATCYATTFANVNLSNTIGLDMVRHDGPSSIGVDTLIRSEGKIPQAFLEGCGVPDNWITYLPSLLGKAIDFYSCFISFSHADEDFTKRLHSRMREDHLRVWYSPEDIRAGRKIHEQIDTAIKLHDKLLVVLSDASMNSEWVKTEVRKARRREVQEGKRVLFPISLVPFDRIREWEAFDADTGKDMAVELREYFIPDFSNWKDHDKFEAAYQRLMRDLKPTPEEA